MIKTVMSGPEDEGKMNENGVEVMDVVRG